MKKPAKKKKETKRFENYPVWTHAGFFGFLRSNIRHASSKYPPIREAKVLARRPYQGDNKRMKWEYQCAECKGWFKDGDTVVDHIIPAGSLKGWEDIAAFCQRLFCSIDGLQVLCKECHAKKTEHERKTNAYEHEHSGGV